MAKNFLDPEGLNLYTQALINGGLKVGKAQDSSFANDASTAFYASHADAEGLLGLIPMENIPIDAQNVFIGEYGVTTYDDIIENINNGKIVFIKQESSNMLYTLVNSNSTFCSFANVRTGVGGWSGLTATEIWVNSSSVWDSSFYQLQDYISDLSNIRSNANNALLRSGGQMTGDLDLNGNALLVRKSGDNIRNGIRFTGEGVREGIYVGNPNMRLFLEADPNLDLIHKKGGYFYDILDTNNVATKGNIYPTTWGDTLDNIINAANAGKIVILKRDITYNEQKYSPTYVLDCFIKRVSDDYITECRFYARLEDNVVAEIACKRGPTWVDNGVMQLQENLVSGTNIKTINGNSVLGSGNIDTHEVFIAEYGVTNPQDVFNAIEEGKLVIAKKSDVYYQPEQWLNDTSIRFVGFGYLNNFNFFDLNSTTWGTVFSYKWQRADEKVSTITGNIDNIKYPTTQAVVDYAQPIIDSSNKLSADLVDDSSTTHKFVTTNEKESWDNKIDKVTSATTGNFASFDSNGDITDSGKKDSDFATAAQGSLADSAYQKPLNGIPASDIESGVIPDVSQFVTRSVNDLLNYYTKQNTYTQAEVDALIGSIQHFHYEIYTELPQSGESNVLYLIGPAGSGKDRYEEYVYANNSFTKIGDTSIDLSNYVTTQALTSALQQFAQDLQTELNNYALKSQIKTVNGNSLIGSGDVSIHPEIVNLTDGEHSSGYYEDLMRTVDVLKLNTSQIFLYTAYNNNHIATTAMCFSACTNTETPTTNAVIKQTLFLGTYKSIRTLSNTVNDNKYQVVDNWAQILDIKQSDLDAKVSKSGSSMTGNLDMNYHELQVCGNRNGIKFESNATGVLIGNGNMNLTIQNGGGDLKHRKGIAPSAVDYSILDTSNIKTVNGNSIYGSGDIDTNDVFWVEYGVTPFADIINALDGGKNVLAFVSESEDDVTIFNLTYVERTVECDFVSVTDGHTYNRFFVFPSDEYTEITIETLEIKRNKVTDFTTINNTKYPTTKAVADYAQPIINSSNKLDADVIDDSSSNNKFVSESEKTTWRNKQDAIADLDNIRRDASAGASAYQKPATGIPASDIESGVIPDVSAFITKSVDDLDNYTTTTDLNGLLAGKQSVIDTSNMLDADLVSDASSNHKFVTASDKTNWDNKQDELIDGTNIKTINDTSILGSGNIKINDVFWVEYNTTPFADILAAYNAGKVLFANYAGMKFVNTTVGMENDSNVFLFSMSGMDENGEIFIFSFTVTSNNGSTDYTNISEQKLQSHLDSSNKLSADLVDDTNSTHKFVTITFRQF